MEQNTVQKDIDNTVTTTLDLGQASRQWNRIRGFSLEILDLLYDRGALSTIKKYFAIGVRP